MATFTPDTSDPAASGAAVTYYTVDNFRPENSMGYLMRRIMGVIAQEVEREMQPFGLTDAQWKPLLRLYLRPANP
nr:MarR family transcriptional regulator [Xylophilus sp.]